jgi:nitrogen fixation protein FixH
MKSSKMWPIVIAGVLAMTVAANVLLWWEASGGDADAVEPDYYRKAVDWDRTQAQQQHNANLGWTLAASIAPLAADGRGTLRVQVLDRAGRALAGAHVVVEAIHNLASLHRLVASVVTGPDGVGFVTLPFARPGSWELRFDIVRGDEQFTTSVRRDAGARR